MAMIPPNYLAYAMGWCDEWTPEQKAEADKERAEWFAEHGIKNVRITVELKDGPTA